MGAGTRHSCKFLQRELSLVSLDDPGLWKWTYQNVLAFLGQVKRETVARKGVSRAIRRSVGVCRPCYSRWGQRRDGDQFTDISLRLKQMVASNFDDIPGVPACVRAEPDLMFSGRGILMRIRTDA